MTPDQEYKRGVRAAVLIIAVLCGLRTRCFDGSKWSRRETPADPFEVTG